MPVAIPLAIASIGISAYSQWKAGAAEKRAGEAQARAAESEAKVIDFNAAVADLQAKDATARGQVEESRFRRGVDVLIGSQRAGFAAGNVDVGFGSTVDVQADAALLGELDALTIRSNAAREAWGHRVEAEDLRQRADVTRREGANLAKAGVERRTAARVGAIGTVVGGSASLLETRYGFGKGK